MIAVGFSACGDGINLEWQRDLFKREGALFALVVHFLRVRPQLRWLAIHEAFMWLYRSVWAISFRSCTIGRRPSGDGGWLYDAIREWCWQLCPGDTIVFNVGDCNLGGLFSGSSLDFRRSGNGLDFVVDGRGNHRSTVIDRRNSEKSSVVPVEATCFIEYGGQWSWMRLFVDQRESQCSCSIFGD